MIGQRSARRTTALALWAAHSLYRTGSALQRLTTAAADSLLNAESKRLLTAQVYDWLPVSRDELFAWEETWLQRDLPQSPARVLVGGCGRGREVGALLARGYEVWGFDPSIDSARQCQHDWPGLSFIGWFGYEQLTRSCSLPVPSERRLLPPGVSFDAALLGWGSLSHVIDEAEQDSLFRLLADLVPAGPILASFYLTEGPGRTASRADRVGADLGRWLGGRHATATPGRVGCSARTGFTYAFDKLRLQVLAGVAARRVTIDIDGFPHATFHLRPTPQQAG